MTENNHLNRVDDNGELHSLQKIAGKHFGGQMPDRAQLIEAMAAAKKGLVRTNMPGPGNTCIDWPQGGLEAAWKIPSLAAEAMQKLPDDVRKRLEEKRTGVRQESRVVIGPIGIGRQDAYYPMRPRSAYSTRTSHGHSASNASTHHSAPVAVPQQSSGPSENGHAPSRIDHTAGLAAATIEALSRAGLLDNIGQFGTRYRFSRDLSKPFPRYIAEKFAQVLHELQDDDEAVTALQRHFPGIPWTAVISVM